MRLTEHFTLEELTKSATAVRLGISNKPDDVIESKLRRLCKEVLEPIRQKYGMPIFVSSGYRCKRLNSAVKGSVTSDHMYGCAADIRSMSDTREENKKLFDLILRMVNSGEIKVKQLIDEYHYDWIHISFQDGRTSKLNQILHLS